jgi:hypothetical protein
MGRPRLIKSLPPTIRAWFEEKALDLTGKELTAELSTHLKRQVSIGTVHRAVRDLRTTVSALQGIPDIRTTFEAVKGTSKNCHFGGRFDPEALILQVFFQGVSDYSRCP